MLHPPIRFLLGSLTGSLGPADDVEGSVLDQVVGPSTFAGLGGVVLHLEVGFDEDLGSRRGDVRY